MAVLQALVRNLQSPLILIDGFFLMPQCALQQSQAAVHAGGGRPEFVNTSTRQIERALRFFDLLVDAGNVAGEIVRFQRKGHDQIAQYFCHGFTALYGSFMGTVRATLHR